MATGRDSETKAASRDSRSVKIVAYGDFIDDQLEKTRGQVKLTEICAALVTLFTAVLGLLLVAAVVDHWLMPLGTLGRWMFLLALVGGGGAFIFFRVAPLFLRRVNPVYAAHSIEEQSPSLKNSLVNFLLLRGGGRGVSKRVLSAVEEQPATGLSGTSVESAVDRTKLIRLGYVLLAVMAACALYKVLSPKDPLETVGRIAAPWANIDAPTRVRITRVTPGDHALFAGEFVKVQVHVRGMGSDEPVRLVWSTDDGRVVDQAIEMKLTDDGRIREYECELPNGTDGLRQSAQYYVAAGDAQSETFTLTVSPPPAIRVTRVDYEYPRYIGRSQRVVENQGDISAPEGTRVTIHAEANQEIAERSAYIDFNCDGVKDRPLARVGKTGAKVTFPLLAGSQLSSSPLHSYQLRFSNTSRHLNPEPSQFKIDIHPDKSPDVEIVVPQRQEVELPINGSLGVHVRAKDRDYGLRRVELLAESAAAAGALLIDKRLLDQELRGLEFKGELVFRPADYKGLRVGDTIRLWSIARDNKETDNEWTPNVSQTARYKVKIVEARKQSNDPSKQPPSKDPQSQPKNSGEKRPNSDPNKQPQGKSEQGVENGEKGDNAEGKGAGQNTEGGQKEPNEKDPEGDLGEAVRKLHDKAKQEKQKKQEQGEAGEENKDENNGKQGQGKQPQGGMSSGGNKEKPQDGTSPKGDGANGPRDGESGGTGGQGGENPTGGGASQDQRNGGAGQGGNNTPDSGAPSSDPAGERKKKPNGSPKSKNSNAGNEMPEENPKENPKAAGDGGNARNTTNNETKNKTKQDGDPAKKGGGDVPKGGSSAGGAASDDPNGSPDAQSEIKKLKEKKNLGKPTQKENAKDENRADSPSQSDRESDNSNAGEEGDRSGAGQKGGGQSSQNEGTGGAGQRTASNEGNGAAPGAGKGPTGTKAGKKKPANGVTGSSGNEEGNGSKTRPGQTSSGAGSKPDNSPRGTGGNPNPQGISKGGRPDPSSRGLAGGRQGQDNPNITSDNDQPGSDPDLEAAKKAVDLVLDYLKDHPDEKLFKDPKTIPRLKKHLENLRRQSEQAGPQGKIARDQLRNLGVTGSSRNRGKDDLGKLYEGPRSKPPAEYSDPAFYDKVGKRPPRR